MSMDIGIALAQAVLGTLGQEGSQRTIHYRDLYACGGYVICLAMLNAVIGITFGSWLSRNPGHRLVYALGALLLYGLWSIQVVLGLAPLVLCVRGITQYPEESAWIYAMPLFQAGMVWFCLYFQLKMIRIYRANFGHRGQGA